MLGYDVPCALQGILYILYVPFHITGGTFLWMRLTLQHQQGGEWFQPLLAGRLGTCFSFGLVGEVDVLQYVIVPSLLNALPEFRSQFALFLNGAENGFLALGSFAQFLILCLDSLNLHFVQSSRCFLAVTADERNCRSVFQQAEGRAYLSF